MTARDQGADVRHELAAVPAERIVEALDSLADALIILDTRGIVTWATAGRNQRGDVVMEYERTNLARMGQQPEGSDSQGIHIIRGLRLIVVRSPEHPGPLEEQKLRAAVAVGAGRHGTVS